MEVRETESVIVLRSCAKGLTLGAAIKLSVESLGSFFQHSFRLQCRQILGTWREQPLKCANM
eukprot:2343829-Pleurochrysis_carterae.AAC.2